MYEGYSKKFNFFPAIQLNYSYTCVMYKYKHVITNKCSMFNVANCRRYNFIIKSNLRKAYCLLKRITSSFLLKFPQTEQFLKFFPNKNFPLKTICTIFPFLANCSQQYGLSKSISVQFGELNESERILCTYVQTTSFLVCSNYLTTHRLNNC